MVTVGYSVPPQDAVRVAFLLVLGELLVLAAHGKVRAVSGEWQVAARGE